MKSKNLRIKVLSWILEVDLEKVIEKADEKTLNKLKKDIDREINTKKERKSGWLDDLGSGFYKD